MNKKRKIVEYKINGEVVCTLRGDVFLNQIDEMAWVIASECEVPIYEIDHEIVELTEEMSEIDVTDKGLVLWTDASCKIITGISIPFELGSDEHLDFMLDEVEKNLAECLYMS